MPRTNWKTTAGRCLWLGLALASTGCRALPTRPPEVPTTPTPAPAAVAKVEEAQAQAEPSFLRPASTPEPTPAVALAPPVRPSAASTDENVRVTDAADAQRMENVKPVSAPEPPPLTWEEEIGRFRDLAARRAEPAEGETTGPDLRARLLARLLADDPVDPAWRPTLEALADGGPPPSAAPAPLPAPEPVPAPTIAAAEPVFGLETIRVCRDVRGYGDYDPIDAVLHPGDPFVLYAEVANLGGHEEGGAFRSTMRPRVELLAADGGQTRWGEDLGVVEDVCRRRRRDCYVNAGLAFPKDIPPGAYRLRLTATDASDGREARAEVAVTLAP